MFVLPNHVSPSHVSPRKHCVEAVRNRCLAIVATNSRCVRADAVHDCSSHACGIIGSLIITVGIQRDDVSRVQDLHRQPLLRRVVVALDADAAEPCVLECFLKHGREVFLISCTRGKATPPQRGARLHQLKASWHLFLFLFRSPSEGPGSRRAFNQTPQNRGQTECCPVQSIPVCSL